MRFPYLLAPAAALILLAGCSGSGHQASTPSVTAQPTSPATTKASATPTPSSTATSPLLTGADVKPGEVPPTLDPHFITDDEYGAIAFAGYFYRALDWSIATTNPNLLRAISAPSCSGCQKDIQMLDRFAAEGRHSEARLSESGASRVNDTLVPAEFVMQVTIDQQADVTVDANGSSTTYAPAVRSAISYLYVKWQNGSFIAEELN
jgi:Family of unknown function (DUF6318)